MATNDTRTVCDLCHMPIDPYHELSLLIDGEWMHNCESCYLNSDIMYRALQCSGILRAEMGFADYSAQDRIDSCNL